MMETDDNRAISKAEFESLARFRRALRQFLRFSELAARSENLTPQQHQLLLTIKGMPNQNWATIGDLADALQLLHSAAVQLVDRCETLGLVERGIDPDDRRVVRVTVTARAEEKLSRLAALHRDELRRLQQDLAPIFAEFT